VKQTVYELFKKHTHKELPWGSLTGIRPAKLARELISELGEERAKKAFISEFDVSGEKLELAFEIADNQKSFIRSAKPEDIDIYIGIPFCASRCKYCSFVSRDVVRAGKMRNEYLEALENEIDSMAGIVGTYNVRAVYIGGGTPTSLETGELERLMEKTVDTFGTGVEFTVEAGRPDTVTREKLLVLKKGGADRISINPQTLKQETLDIIGRRHSVDDFYRAYDMAKSAGFESVNTDIILGLPGEDAGDMAETIEGIAGLKPDNVTIHTLAIKNSSEFARENTGHFCDNGIIECMTGRAREILGAEGYIPYYLYRQKYMNGNLENTGYAQPGRECIYNIDNMEETVSVLAFGAGAISKRIFGKERRIERAANVKDVEQYIARNGEMAERKRALFY